MAEGTGNDDPSLVASLPPSTDRRILSLAVPAFGALVAEPLFLLADAAIVGRLGTVPLAGLGVAAALLGGAVSVFVFLAYGTTATVARRVGSGEGAGALSLGVDALWLAAGLGIAVAMIGAALARTLVGLFGVGDDVAAEGATYLLWAMPGVPGMFVVMAATGVLRGAAGRPDTAGRRRIRRDRQRGAQRGAGPRRRLGDRRLRVGNVDHATRHGDGRARRRRQRCPTAGRTAAAASQRDQAGGDDRRTADGPDAHHARGPPADDGRRRAPGRPALAAHQVAITVWTLLALALDALAIAGQTLTGSALGAGDVHGMRTAMGRMIRWGCGSGGRPRPAPAGGQWGARVPLQR